MYCPSSLPYSLSFNSQWLHLATNIVPHIVTSFKLLLNVKLLLKSLGFSFFTVKREYSLLVGSCGVFSILLEEANILLTKGNL